LFSEHKEPFEMLVLKANMASTPVPPAAAHAPDIISHARLQLLQEKVGEGRALFFTSQSSLGRKISWVQKIENCVIDKSQSLIPRLYGW
jgi:hypothetical protein